MPTVSEIFDAGAGWNRIDAGNSDGENDANTDFIMFESLYGDMEASLEKTEDGTNSGQTKLTLSSLSNAALNNDCICNCCWKCIYNASCGRNAHSYCV